MLGFLRRLFGRTGGNAKDSVPVSRYLAPNTADHQEKEKDEESGTAGSNAKETHDSTFFCREALVGRDQKIVGYEFGYPQQMQPRIMGKRVRVHRYYDDVLLRHLAGLELDSFLGDRLALVEISHVSLEHPSLEALLHRKIALLLSFPESGMPDAKMFTRTMTTAGQLHDNGARIGLKWQFGWPWKMLDLPLLSPVDFIQIAWPDYVGMDFSALFSGLRRSRSQSAAPTADMRQTGPLRLIAGDLRTLDDFRQCYRLGFDFFRGAFINSRDQDRGSKSPVNRLRVLQLLNGLRRETDTSRLEEELKQDPILSYRLLTYANSPLMGLTSKVSQLGHAMIVIGRDKLYRWLASLLFNVSDPGYYEWALTEQALARAALMERLGKSVEGAEPDALFLTGLFSLLDQLVGKPMEELMTEIQLPEDIRAALVHREGALARFLALAEACEHMDPDTIARHAEALGLSSRTVNLAVFDALSWAQTMIRLNAE